MRKVVLRASLALLCFLFVVSVLILRPSLIFNSNLSRVSVTPVPGTSAQRVHNLSTGFNYTTIQEAIFAPNTLDGNVIGVDEGTYVENVNVSKSLAIEALGQPDRTIIQAAASNAPALRVTADNVTVEGFSITGSFSFVRSSGMPGSAVYVRLGGITLESCRFCNIHNNTCFGNSYGIFLNGACDNSVHENIVSNSTESGIGIYYRSNNNTISKNVSLRNRNGVEMESSYNNLVVENSLSENTGNAVCLSSGEATDPNLSKNNTILRNEIFRNNVAIELYASVENNITENNVSCNNYDFSFSYVSNDLIYHNNFVNNSAKVYSVYDPHGTVRLDDGHEGNYWSDCSGECYPVDETNQDNHPLKSPYP